MDIVRCEPFPEMVSLRQAMDRLFKDSLVRPSRLFGALGEAAAPAIDAYQTPIDVVVKAALPGLKAEDISIDITGDTLTIKGECKEDQEIKKENYLCKEMRYGAFFRTISLPSGLQSDRAEATLEDGNLTLTIPKAEEVKPKTIEIKAKETK
ncbi:MAG: Hsp20/alpha crystallin family protein [Chloroflexi bacterium]|nr:Hsp20/alpha crystallin family protein [Chloroflexota bacterium]